MAVLTLAVGWVIPLFGITLAGFLLVDAVIGVRRSRRREAGVHPA